MFLKNMTQNSQYEDERTPSTITMQKTMRTTERRASGKISASRRKQRILTLIGMNVFATLFFFKMNSEH